MKGRLMQASSASSSIQDPSDHADLPAVELVPLGQTKFDVDEPTVLEVLTEYPEITFERGDLPEVDAIDELFLPDAAEDDRSEAQRPPPEWCVDQGETIVAMTTFELWLALARRDVDAETRVWGMGMDRWEAVADVPDLAHALTDSLSLAPPPVMPRTAEIMSPRGHDRTPLGFGTTDAANDDYPAESRPISRRFKGFTFGRVTLAAGCLVAAAAIGLMNVPRTDMADQAPTANCPMAIAHLRSAMERANREVDAAAVHWLEREAARAVEPVAPSARQHRDRDLGQRRSRRGHH